MFDFPKYTIPIAVARSSAPNIVKPCEHMIQSPLHGLAFNPFSLIGSFDRGWIEADNYATLIDMNQITFTLGRVARG